MRDLFIRLKRKYQNRQGIKKIKVEFAGTQTPKNHIQRLRFLIRFRFIFIALIVIILIALLINFVASYLQISNYQFLQDSSWAVSKTPLEKSNTLVFIFLEANNLIYVNTACVISFTNPEESKLLVIDPLLFTTVYGLDKELPISNVVAYAQTNKQNKLENLKKSLETLTALNLDNYVAIDFNTLPASEKKSFKESQENNDALFNLQSEWCTSYVKNKLEFSSLIMIFNYVTNPSVATYSSLNKQEYIYWLSKLFNYRIVKSTQISLSDAVKIKKGEAYIYRPDTLNIDRELKNFFIDDRVLKEQLRVEIFNASTQAGYSRKLQRQLELYGVTVTKIGNFPETVNSNVLYVKDSKISQYTVELVKSLLQGNVLVTSEEYPYNTNADIILVLGNQQ